MSDDDLTVAEFLETEFYFEVASYLDCTPQRLFELKKTDPTRFASAAKHVLMHVVTDWCRQHILNKADRRRALSQS